MNYISFDRCKNFYCDKNSIIVTKLYDFLSTRECCCCVVMCECCHGDGSTFSTLATFVVIQMLLLRDMGKSVHYAYVSVNILSSTVIS